MSFFAAQVESVLAKLVYTAASSLRDTQFVLLGAMTLGQHARLALA